MITNVRPSPVHEYKDITNSDIAYQDMVVVAYESDYHCACAGSKGIVYALRNGLVEVVFRGQFHVDGGMLGRNRGWCIQKMRPEHLVVTETIELPDKEAEGWR